jgi:uncharacterized glyoxalase superfamily protein PhnB
LVRHADVEKSGRTVAPVDRCCNGGASETRRCRLAGSASSCVHAAACDVSIRDRSTMAKKRAKQPHPNALYLTVANVPRAAAFYVEKLGFKLLGQWPDDGPDRGKPIYARVELDNQTLMLGELPSLQEAKQMGMDAAEIELVKQDARAIARGTTGVGICYYLRVADCDRFAAKMKKRRIKLLLPPKTQFYGARECALADLDGYRLVFYSPAAKPEAPAS